MGRTDKEHPSMMQYLFLAMARLTEPRDDDRGAGMVEYGLRVAFIALVALIGVSFLGTELSDFFTDVGNKLPVVN
ncbi:MAG TPA: Flp family type IVb pilin [Acidimicrobiales bacterium]